MEGSCVFSGILFLIRPFQGVAYLWARYQGSPQNETIATGYAASSRQRTALSPAGRGISPAPGHRHQKSLPRRKTGYIPNSAFKGKIKLKNARFSITYLENLLGECPFTRRRPRVSSRMCSIYSLSVTRSSAAMAPISSRSSLSISRTHRERIRFSGVSGMSAPSEPGRG